MNRLSRREFVRLSTTLTASTLAAACATPAPSATLTPQPTTSSPAEPTAPPISQPTTPPAAEPSAATEVRYKEAPMLADLVASGEIPPVDERLPLNPCVCPVLEMTGKYGGRIRRAFKGVSDGNGPEKMISTFLLYFTHDLSLRPDMAQSWEVNEDASEYTLHLREGMKWNDASPFTSRDLQWWYEHDLLNTDLNPMPSVNYTTGPEKTVMIQSAPDDYTVVYKFAHPNPLYIYTLAMNGMWHPAEYAQQWHIETTDDRSRIEREIAERGYQTWMDVFRDRTSWRNNPDVPQITPWVSTNTMADELFICKRNPYFWQVDEDGNQLPYIDELTHRLFETIDVFNMWILNGEIDFQGRHVELSNYTLFKQEEERGGYNVHMWANDATQIMCLNETVQNPPLREFFENANCRKAISYAINREEIIELVYDGLTNPRQYSPPETSPQYYPKLTTAYIEYDPDRANEMLDAEGYTTRDGEGYRLYKDGSGPITFVLEDYSQATADEMEMISTYLRDVGLKMVFKVYERSLVEEHCQANQIDARYTLASRALLPLVDPNFFLGFAGDKSFGYAWTIWYNDPTSPNAEEPPEDGFAKKMWAIWEQIKIEPDTNKHTDMFKQILEIHYQELPYVGICGDHPQPVIVKRGLRNLPLDMQLPWSNPIKHDGFIPLQTYFWE